MVKAIFATPLTRKVVATAMFVSAVAGASATNKGNDLPKERAEQVEVASKSSVTALKARIINMNYNKTSHNKKLDKKYSEIYSSNLEKKKYLTERYNQYGFYGASIVLQKEIDDFYLESSISEYLSNNYLSPKEVNSLKAFLKEFKTWRETEYSPMINEVVNSIVHKVDFPLAEDYNKALDRFVQTSSIFILNSREIYNDRIQKFVSKQKDKDSEQAKSDLLAYKTHIINSLAYSIQIHQKRSMPYYFGLNRTVQIVLVDGEANVKP